MVIEVPDIFTSQGGVWRSLRDASVAKDGILRDVTEGSGVAYNDDWYVLNQSTYNVNFETKITLQDYSFGPDGGNAVSGIRTSDNILHEI